MFGVGVKRSRCGWTSSHYVSEQRYSFKHDSDDYDPAGVCVYGWVCGGWVHGCNIQNCLECKYKTV